MRIGSSNVNYNNTIKDMKLKTLIAIVLCAMVPAVASAKKSKKVAEPAKAEVETTVVEETEPAITEDCTVNASLFSESAKNKQYEDAYQPWLAVFTDCPNYSRAIYTQGAKILEWKIKNAKDAQEKDFFRQMLMQMHDKRIKYFGNDPKYPTAYVLGLKALDYCDNYPEDELKETAYGWLKESVDGMKEKSQINVLVRMVELSYAIYKTDMEKYRDQFINDCTTASGYLNVQANNPSNKNAKVAGQQRDYVDGLFAQSGAASCEKLDELYAKVVTDNVNNLEMLGKIITLYKRVNCNESEVYFAASKAAHDLQPTEESAAGCAKMCMKKEDWDGAINYYEEALSLITEEVDEDKADYLYNIAFIKYTHQKKYAESRTYARRSLEVNPNQGRCYMLIGFCYAASKPYSEQEYAAKAQILNKTVFWAAVDQFVRAKQVDESIAELASKYISEYSKYFPTKEEMFDLPNEFSAPTFLVGGWINERTSCRPAR